MGEQKNIVIAVVLSVAILVAWEFFQPPAPPSAETPAVTEAAAPDAGATTPALPTTDVVVPGTPEPAQAVAPVVPQRDLVLAQVKRVPIATPRLKGSISTKGGRVDDVSLVNYQTELAEGSPDVTLLSPSGTENAYYAEFGWTAAAGQGQTLPNGDTVWASSGAELKPGQPVVLTWDNGQGLRFTRTFEVDENYMFTVTQRVDNTSGKEVTLFPYGLISRSNTPEVSGLYILHEGPLGVLDGSLKEVDYDQLQKDGPIKTPSKGGWIGITDKYWLTALVPDQAAQVNTSFFYHQVDGKDRYQTDYMGEAKTIPSGQSAQVGNRFFAGAKEVNLLDAYTENLNIDRMDLAIDFGWFYFLTKPFFHALRWFHGVFGNFGLAILALTVLVKLALFPLANKSYKAMSKMKKIQPQMKKLQERFKDDKTRLNQEMMDLYKKEGANPAAGCLPIFVQIPVFFALYKVLFVTIEMRHAPFYGWIKDLSAPDPTTVLNLFGLIPWTPPAFLAIGIWPVIMGLTMWVQQKLNPAPTDPVQASMMKYLPLIFTFILGAFPAGLVIYWAWNNSLSILQQWWIMRSTADKA